MQIQKAGPPTLIAAIGATLVTCALAACAGDLPSPGEPASLPQARLDEMVEHGAKAKAVFVGEVIAIEHRLSQPDADGHVVPFHFVTWRVARAIRGVDQGATWTGRFAGGPFGDGRTLSVSEVPDMAIGQRALVLADDGDAGACPLVGCRDGMLVVSDAGGERLAPAELDHAVAALASRPGVAARARSVDPDAPFAFAMPTARSPRRTASTPSRRPPPVLRAEGAADQAERDAFERNRRNPVLP